MFKGIYSYIDMADKCVYFDISDSHESEIDVDNYTADYIKKCIVAYEKRAEQLKEYRQRKRDEETEEQRELRRAKQREYAKRYYDKKKQDQEWMDARMDKQRVKRELQRHTSI